MKAKIVNFLKIMETYILSIAEADIVCEKTSSCYVLAKGEASFVSNPLAVGGRKENFNLFMSRRSGSINWNGIKIVNFSAFRNVVSARKLLVAIIKFD